MELKAHIPNAVTLLNLISGSVAAILLLKGYPTEAALLVGLSALFDFLDGFFAKLLNVKSMIGKELDSLADVISFGLVPALFLYYIMSRNELVESGNTLYSILPYFSLLIAAFSALRLAKFNLDNRQTVSFLGLPTPANAVFIVSFAIVVLQGNSGFSIIDNIAGNLWVQLLIIPVSCVLLISELPMFSLKFYKGYGFKTNIIRYTFLLGTIILVVLLSWTGILFSIMLYIIMSVIFGEK